MTVLQRAFNCTLYIFTVASEHKGPLLHVGEINVVCSRLRVPQDVLLPLTKRDECKLASLLKRPYLSSQPQWKREVRWKSSPLSGLFTFCLWKTLLKMKLKM